MQSDFMKPGNTWPLQVSLPVCMRVGSENMVNGLAEAIMDIAGKILTIKHIPGRLELEVGIRIIN